MTRINQLGKLKRFGVLGSAVLVGRGINYYTRKYLLGRKLFVRGIHGYHMRLRLDDPGLSKDIAIRGTREEQLKYIIDREVKPGDVVLDLGANIGYYTIMLAKLVGSSGKIYAMEPEPRNFDLLQENIKLNQVEAIVESFHMGASDSQGVGKLYLSKYSNIHSFLSHDDEDPDNSHFVEVLLTDVSTFVQGKRPVDMLRMDIEGYEVEVIQGLEKAIKDGSFSGRILFECHFPRYVEETHSMKKPLQMLIDQGYHARYLTSGDESKPRIRARGYEPMAVVQFDDKRFRGIYENVADNDLLSLVCETGGVRDVMMEKVKTESAQGLPV